MIHQYTMFMRPLTSAWYDATVGNIIPYTLIVDINTGIGYHAVPVADLMASTGNNTSPQFDAVEDVLIDPMTANPAEALVRVPLGSLLNLRIVNRATGTEHALNTKLVNNYAQLILKANAKDVNNVAYLDTCLRHLLMLNIILLKVNPSEGQFINHKFTYVPIEPDFPEGFMRVVFSPNITDWSLPNWQQPQWNDLRFTII